ncbi:hypothetical protein [Actinomadura sp. 7K507]|nr:hypothetical protein [Actinomadura sp. 7K507]
MIEGFKYLQDHGLVGGIGEYEGLWRMAYVRGLKESSRRWPSVSASEETS